MLTETQAARVKCRPECTTKEIGQDGMRMEIRTMKEHTSMDKKKVLGNGTMRKAKNYKKKCTKLVH